MIKSVMGKGKIYSGDTKLSSDLIVIQSGAMQLTISAGSFTTTGDARLNIAPQTYTLITPQVINIAADAVEDKAYRVELGLDNGVVDILCQSRFVADINYQTHPIGWVTIHPLIFEFIVPANTANLSGVDIYVLTVEAGFPAGTDANDWQVQNG